MQAPLPFVASTARPLSIDHLHTTTACQINKAKDLSLRLSRSELGYKLDTMREKLIELRLQQKKPDDLWCDLMEFLEAILEQCSAEDLAWFHHRADELILQLFDRSGSTHAAL